MQAVHFAGLGLATLAVALGLPGASGTSLEHVPYDVLPAILKHCTLTDLGQCLLTSKAIRIATRTTREFEVVKQLDDYRNKILACESFLTESSAPTRQGEPVPEGEKQCAEVKPAYFPFLRNLFYRNSIEARLAAFSISSLGTITPRRLRRTPANPIEEPSETIEVEPVSDEMAADHYRRHFSLDLGHQTIDIANQLAAFRPALRDINAVVFPRLLQVGLTPPARSTLDPVMYALASGHDRFLAALTRFVALEPTKRDLHYQLHQEIPESHYSMAKELFFLHEERVMSNAALAGMRNSPEGQERWQEALPNEVASHLSVAVATGLAGLGHFDELRRYLAAIDNVFYQDRLTLTSRNRLVPVVVGAAAAMNKVKILQYYTALMQPIAVRVLQETLLKKGLVLAAARLAEAGKWAHRSAATIDLTMIAKNQLVFYNDDQQLFYLSYGPLEQAI